MFKKYCFFFFLGGGGGCSEKKIYVQHFISYWSEVNRNIIKPQFSFLHHQEEKTLKRLVEVEI